MNIFLQLYIIYLVWTLIFSIAPVDMIRSLVVNNTTYLADVCFNPPNYIGGLKHVRQQEIELPTALTETHIIVISYKYYRIYLTIAVV